MTFEEWELRQESRQPGWVVIRELLEEMEATGHFFSLGLARYDTRSRTHLPTAYTGPRTGRALSQDFAEFVYQNAVTILRGLPVGLTEALVEHYVRIDAGGIEEMDGWLRSSIPNDWLESDCIAHGLPSMIVFHDAATVVVLTATEHP